MSEQGDAFVRHVLKGNLDQAGWSLDDAVTWLRHKAGSGRKAAALAGVSPSTLRRWATGTTPKPATAARVVATTRDLQTRAVSKLGDAGTIVPVLTRESGRPDRLRDIWGSQLQLVEGTTEAARAVWIATGDADAAYRRFLQGVQEPWYRSQMALGAKPPARRSGYHSDNEDDMSDDDEEEAYNEFIDSDQVMESDYGFSIA